MKTMMLLATLTALLVWAGTALAGQHGFVMALVLAGVLNAGAYWWSDTIILRMSRAQEVTEAEARVERLVAMARHGSGFVVQG